MSSRYSSLTATPSEASSSERCLFHPPASNLPLTEDSGRCMPLSHPLNHLSPPVHSFSYILHHLPPLPSVRPPHLQPLSWTCARRSPQSCWRSQRSTVQCALKTFFESAGRDISRCRHRSHCCSPVMRNNDGETGVELRSSISSDLILGASGFCHGQASLPEQPQNLFESHEEGRTTKPLPWQDLRELGELITTTGGVYIFHLQGNRHHHQHLQPILKWRSPSSSSPALALLRQAIESNIHRRCRFREGHYHCCKEPVLCNRSGHCHSCSVIAPV